MTDKLPTRVLLPRLSSLLLSALLACTPEPPATDPLTCRDSLDCPEAWICDLQTHQCRDSATIPRCIPGHTSPCTCQGGLLGIQRCNDLGRYDTCACESDDAGTDTTPDTEDPDATDIGELDSEADIPPSSDATDEADATDEDTTDATPSCDDQDRDNDGFSECDGDCDDTHPDVYPGAPQRCDGLANDCLQPLPIAEQDQDLDGLSPCQGDCDDTDPAVHPDADEACDDTDNDCDDLTDEGLASETWYLDDDGDGFGANHTARPACAPLPDGTTTPGDCNDLHPEISPEAPPRCQPGADDDCNAIPDCAQPDCTDLLECCPTDPILNDNTEAEPYTLTENLVHQGLLCGDDTQDWYTLNHPLDLAFVRATVCSHGGPLDVEAFTLGNRPNRRSFMISPGSCTIINYLFDNDRGSPRIAVRGAWAGLYTIRVEFPSEQGTQCQDGADNDGDGATDCADLDCSDLDHDTFYGSQCGPTNRPDCNDHAPTINPLAYEQGDACSDGLDNDCNDLIDCQDYNCDDEPPCSLIGCTPEDQEPGEPNNDPAHATPMQWGQEIQGGFCDPDDPIDYFRLCGAYEGLQYQCLLQTDENNGLAILQGRVDEGGTPGAWVIDAWHFSGLARAEGTVLDWQVGPEGCWLLTVRATNDPDANTYTLRCDQLTGSPTESHCWDDLDNDNDGDTDCDDTDCFDSERCPCASTGFLSCSAPRQLSLLQGTSRYYRYSCNGNGYRGREQILRFTAPREGTYHLSAVPLQSTIGSNTITLDLLDPDTACRYGTCLASDEGFPLVPATTSVTLQAGQEILAVIDSRIDGPDLVQIAIQCPGDCPDADGDGFTSTSCGGLDCDDLDPTINPTTIERCDDRDTNCSPLDEPFTTFFRDVDNDGYGDPDVPTRACQQPPGYVRNSNDCDDNNPTRPALDLCPPPPDDTIDPPDTDPLTCGALPPAPPRSLYEDSSCFEPASWPMSDTPQTIRVEFAFFSQDNVPAMRQRFDPALVDALILTNLALEGTLFQLGRDADHLPEAHHATPNDLATFTLGGCPRRPADFPDDGALLAEAVPWSNDALRIAIVEDLCICARYEGNRCVEELQGAIGIAIGDGATRSLALQYADNVQRQRFRPFVVLKASALTHAHTRHALAHELGHLIGGLRHPHDCAEPLADTPIDRVHRIPTDAPGACTPAYDEHPSSSCEDSRWTPACALEGAPISVLPFRNVMSYNKVWDAETESFCPSAVPFTDEQLQMLHCELLTRFPDAALPYVPTGNSNEDCTNGRDDDNDSWSDCDDFDCGRHPSCPTEPRCQLSASTLDPGASTSLRCCGITYGTRMEIQTTLPILPPLTFSAQRASPSTCLAEPITLAPDTPPGSFTITARDLTTGRHAPATTLTVR